MEAKLRTTANFLAAFAKNGPGQIDQAGGDALFATSEDDREALA